MKEKEFLFQNIESWEDPYDQPFIVCIEHKRFVPCRPCMYRTPASIPYSADWADVQKVRIHQQGEKGNYGIIPER